MLRQRISQLRPFSKCDMAHEQAQDHQSAPDSTTEGARAALVKGNLHGLAIKGNIVVPLESIFCSGSIFKLNICSTICFTAANAYQSVQIETRHILIN